VRRTESKEGELVRRREREVVRKWMELSPPHYLSPSFLSILLLTTLPHSYPSSSLPLSLLPFNLPPHLSILHSSQSATSLPLFSFL
jgi:hypothetical protein